MELYMDSPIRLHVFGAAYSTLTMGPNPDAGQTLMGVAPHDTWFGGKARGPTLPTSLSGPASRPATIHGIRPSEAQRSANLIARFPRNRTSLSALTGV